jgi:hypothetical protein
MKTPHPRSIVCFVLLGLNFKRLRHRVQIVPLENTNMKTPHPRSIVRFARLALNTSTLQMLATDVSWASTTTAATNGPFVKHAAKRKRHPMVKRGAKIVCQENFKSTTLLWCTRANFVKQDGSLWPNMNPAQLVRMASIKQKMPMFQWTVNFALLGKNFNQQKKNVLNANQAGIKVIRK